MRKEQLKQALLAKSDDQEWKDKVYSTIKRYQDQGETEAQAVMSAVSELNIVKEKVDSMSGYFLKKFQGKQGWSAIVLAEGEEKTAQISIEAEMIEEFPAYPCAMKATHLERRQILTSGDVKFALTGKTKLEFTKVNPEKLFEQAELLGDAEEGYRLVKAQLIEVVCFDKAGKFEDANGKLNLKINMVSQGEKRVRSGAFARTWADVKNLCPSIEDQKRFDDIKQKVNSSGDYSKLLDFMKGISFADFEMRVDGTDILAYGLVKDNPWKKPDGTIVQGKNISLGNSGFIYSLDLLFDMGETRSEVVAEKPKKEKKKKKEEAPAPVPTPAPPVDESDDEEEDEEEEEEVEETPKVAKIPPMRTSNDSIATPEGKTIDDKICETLSNGSLSVNEIASKTGGSPNEVALAINRLMSKSKLIIKDGKFAMA